MEEVLNCNIIFVPLYIESYGWVTGDEWIGKTVKESNCGLIIGIILTSERTEENHKNLSQNISNLELPEYTTGIMTQLIRMFSL
jgi:hypothetical protein